MVGRREGRWFIFGGAATVTAVVLFIGLAIYALLSFDVSAASVGLIDAYTWRILRFTLWQATLSTVLSVALGLLVALALARQRNFPGRIWIIRLMAVPMGLPVIVGALGLISIWGRQGVLNMLLQTAGVDAPLSIYGLSGILLAHVFFNLPLATRFFLAGLEAVPGEYWRMGSALGFGPLATFRFVEWPAVARLLPGVAGLIFMLCATSFTLVLLLGGGPAATTIEVAIYQALRFDFDPPRAIALSVMQIAMTGALLALLALLPSAEPDRQSQGRPVLRMDGRKAGPRLWDSAVILSVLFLVGAPLCAVASAGLSADLWRLLSAPTFLQAAATSFQIALFSGLLAVFASYALVRARHAIALRREAGFSLKAFLVLMGAGSSLVLLVPPVVLGSGWFLLLRPFGDVAALAPVIVAIINMLMSLPFTMRVIEPAFLSHDARTGRLSAALGLRGLSRFRFVDWPVLWRPTATAFFFAMALSLGDLGAVALFGSENFVTLPWLVYSNMGSYRTQDAAGYAFILGVICLVLAAGGVSRRSMKATA